MPAMLIPCGTTGMACTKRLQAIDQEEDVLVMQQVVGQVQESFAPPRAPKHNLGAHCQCGVAATTNPEQTLASRAYHNQWLAQKHTALQI